jgi:hypothetical protein
MLDPVEAYVVEFLLSNKSEFNAYDAESTLLAQLAVPKVEPLWVPINDPVNDPVLTANVIDVAADAVVAKDEDIALFAQLDVPINVPVNDPLKLPVLICVDEDTIPVGNIVGANEAEVATLLVPNNDPVIPPEFIRSEPVINTLPLISKSAVGTALSIPIRLPVTTRVFLLKVPMTTLSSLKTSSMGNPEMSFTLISEPDN